MSNLSRLSPSELTSRLYELRSKERELLVEFLAHLGELDRRKVALDLGFPSSFEYCVQHLGLSSSATFRRLTAARLLMRFPVVADYLRDGRLVLTTLVVLRDVLCDERLGEILDRAAGRSEDEVRALVAALAPRPAVPDLVRRLPQRPSAARPSAECVPTRNLDLFEAAAAATGRNFTAAPAVAPCQPKRSAAKVEPISAEQHVVRMTVGAEFVADLERVRAALSHVVPDRSLEKVLHECIRRTLRACERRRLGGEMLRTAASRPGTPTATSSDDPLTASAKRTRTIPAKVRATASRPGTPTGTSSEYPPTASAKRTRTIPAKVRATVAKRDGNRCTFVGEDGHRCNSTYQIEFHHVEPFARGGPSTVEGIVQMCSAHNRRTAEKELGEARVAEAIARRRDRRGCEAPPG